VIVGDITGKTDWKTALDGVDAVVHLAARAHVVNERDNDPEGAFMRANYEMTRRLADACCGRIKRFVFMSTVAVHGPQRGGGVRNEDSEIAPDTAYGRSKARAEFYLAELRARGDLESVSLRPPLVYGPGAPGNLRRLVSLVRRGVRLPFGAIRNRRSLIAREHLARNVVSVLAAPNPTRAAYCVADWEALGTPEIVRALALGAGVEAKFLSVPVGLMRAAGSLVGKRRMIEQLVGSLEVDASAFREEFGDLQPFATIEGLERMMRDD